MLLASDVSSPFPKARGSSRYTGLAVLAPLRCGRVVREPRAGVCAGRCLSGGAGEPATGHLKPKSSSSSPMKPFALALGLRTRFLVAGCRSTLGRHQTGNVRGVSGSAGFFLSLSTCSAFAKLPNSGLGGGGVRPWDPAARDSPQRLGPPSPAWLCNQPPTPPQSPCAPGGLRHAMPAPLRYRALILLGHGLRAKAYYSVNDPALSSGDLGQRLHAN